MNDLRLNRKDGVFIAAGLLILVAGVLVSLRYFKKAFPEATIEFRYDRGQSGRIAQHFADILNWQERVPAQQISLLHSMHYQ